MKISKAHNTDASALTELTIRSKDHWNYGAKQIEEWRADLTVTPDYIDENEVYKLTDSNTLVGFYAFQAENQEVVKLHFLFVEPEFIGKGYGKILMNDFLTRTREIGYQKATLDSDPNTEKFYTSFGFNVIGQMKTKVEGRLLPIMEMGL